MSSALTMENELLQEIEQKVAEIIRINQSLRDENQQLKAENAGLQSDQQKLIEQNEIARKKIADMIHRLRSIETNEFQ